MLHYAVIFLVIAIIASVLGARGVAGMSAQIGYMLVVVAVIFLVVSMITGCVPGLEAASAGLRSNPFVT